MIDPFLLGLAIVGFVCSLIAIYFVIKVKNAFAALPRLERPWFLLGLGIGSLLIAILTVPINDLLPSFVFAHLIRIVMAVWAAFFILAAMVTMKHAWTIGEGD